MDAVQHPPVPYCTLPECSEEEQKLRLRKWWGLGELKWKERIDPHHWKWGSQCYDDCLHGGNRGVKEPGYQSSMEAAAKFIGDHIGQRTTPEMWYACHALVMQHLPKADPGLPRTVGNFMVVAASWTGVPNGVSEQCKAEMNSTRPSMCNLIASNEFGCADIPNVKWVTESESISAHAANGGGYHLYMQPLEADTMIGHFKSVLDQFYYKVDQYKDGTDMDRMSAVIWLHQVLQRVEFSRDGNSRTGLLFLNKHLIENGFHPLLLNCPNAVATSSYVDFVPHILYSMELWKKHCEKTDEELAAMLPTRKVEDGQVHRLAVYLE